jgi:sugar fermentation stimulation protein A
MNFTFQTEPADFLERPNRFRVVVRRVADGVVVDAHCPDPGRLRELLLPGVRVHISRATSLKRKTPYDLRFVEDPDHGRLISLDTRLPNHSMYTHVEREISLPHIAANGVRSRIDFRLSNAEQAVCWVEIKSATLVVDREARFPDAPTERGRRHVTELATLVAEGAHAAIVFIVQRGDADRLRPNWETDPAFGEALAAARTIGVELYAYTCNLHLDSIELAREIPVLVDRDSETGH